MNNISISSELSWNDLSGILVNCNELSEIISRKYVNELTTVDYLNGITHLNDYLEKWIRVQIGARIRRPELCKGYIEDGDDAYNAKTEHLAADFYTKAIYHAPEKSSELEVACAKRTKCLSRVGNTVEMSQLNQQMYRPKCNLEEKYELSVGRFVVVNESVKKGSLIMEEEAYAFVPVYNFNDLDPIFYHCQNCAKTSCVPFPCQKCLRASYCSAECKQLHQSIHRFECAGYEKNLWINIGIAHLAFRTFVVGFNESLKPFAKMNENSSPSRVLLSLTGTPEPDPELNYKNVLNLVSNFDEMDTTDLCLYALTAQMLVVYLDRFTDFFKSLPPTCSRLMPDIEDWKRYARTVIMRHMGHLVMNAHTMSTIEFVPPTLYGKEYSDTNNSVRLRDFHLVTEINLTFSAIYPKTSILNHSCDENARNFFDGRTLKMFAQYDIAENMEVFNSYGPNYKQMSKFERQSALTDRYYFQCKCDKCRNSDNEQLNSFICPNEKCRSAIQIRIGEPRWWNYLDHDMYSPDVLKKFVCNKCKELLKINPKLLNEYFENVRTIKSSEVSQSRQVELIEEAAYYFLDVVSILTKGHELRSTMAEVLLGFDMFDLVKKPHITMLLTLIAVDYNKNTEKRFGIYSLEYVKSITYLIHTLSLHRAGHMDFKKMIVKSLNIDDLFEAIKILPDSSKRIFENHTLNAIKIDYL